jgi:hypothetical protein
MRSLRRLKQSALTLQKLKMLPRPPLSHKKYQPSLRTLISPMRSKKSRRRRRKRLVRRWTSG